MTQLALFADAPPAIAAARRTDPASSHQAAAAIELSGRRIDILGLTRKETKQLLQIRRNIVCRCFCQTHDNYSDYGGRGIGVCDEWKRSPIAFATWAMANGYRPGLEIDRIDNDGHYEPGNCRIATRSQNCMNKRKHRFKSGRETSSIYKGVNRSRNRWMARIGVEYIGMFRSEIEAAQAYDRAAIERFGEFARPNFPERVS